MLHYLSKVFSASKKFELIPLAIQANRLYNLSMSYSSKFFRLQQNDTQLDRIQARLNELERLLSDDSILKEAEVRLNGAEADLQANRKSLLQAEQQVQNQRIKISQNEASLYGGKIHNPKELQDLQNEVASQKKYLTALEDRQLEAMLATEEAEDRSKSVRTEQAQIQASLIEKNAHLMAEKTELLHDKERLEIEHKAAASALAPADLGLYEQLRKIRNGVAVAKISEKACSACGVGLTPAMIQAANSPAQVTRCTSCGRILFPG